MAAPQWLDYDWLRAGHIISVIAWMAGLLMYPRLLIYRLEADGNAPFEAAMDKAAANLRKIILAPSMVLAWGFGGLLLWKNWEGYLHAHWMWGKLILITAITVIHHLLLPIGRRIAQGERPISSRRLRMLNELPFVLAIVVVILAVAQPGG